MYFKNIRITDHAILTFTYQKKSQRRSSTDRRDGSFVIVLRLTETYGAALARCVDGVLAGNVRAWQRAAAHLPVLITMHVYIIAVIDAKHILPTLWRLILSVALENIFI